MIVEAGLRERGRIAGPRSAYSKAFVTQREQKRDAKRMVLSPNAEQVRSHEYPHLLPSGSIGVRSVLATVIGSVIPASAASRARRSTRRPDRKGESIRMRQQARRSALHIVED